MRQIPGKKKRFDKDPLTGEERWFDAKPAKVRLKVRTLNKLKDAAAQALPRDSQKPALSGLFLWVRRAAYRDLSEIGKPQTSKALMGATQLAYGCVWSISRTKNATYA